MFSSISIPVPFTENILQPDQSDIPNEVDKVCIVKTRKQSAEENAWKSCIFLRISLLSEDEQ
jgi:hypothetical protein